VSRNGDAVGVLGGTFDPVHDGHLRIAGRARELLGLARVLLLPTARPPHKPAGALAPIAHRLAMVELACAGTAGLGICRLELGGDRSYTIDTLRRLRDGDPPCRPVFILGMDALLQITSWRAHDALLREFDLAAVDRRDAELEQKRHRLPREVAARIVRVACGPAPREPVDPGRGGRIFHLAGAPIPVSSSDVRARAARSEGLSGLVPPGVAEYIQRMGLYSREEAR
jgi:nicotinate-nucleotide adenylyltransferase